MARAIAAGAGLDGSGGSPGAERDAHTISNGPRRSRKAVRGRGLLSSQEAPSALNGEQQAELKAAVQELPSQAGIELSSWNWKAVRR